nr:craniofacial development protein 2-like [Tanacetum cinerariifolium]
MSGHDWSIGSLINVESTLISSLHVPPPYISLFTFLSLSLSPQQLLSITKSRLTCSFATPNWNPPLLSSHSPDQIHTNLTLPRPATRRHAQCFFDTFIEVLLIFSATNRCFGAPPPASGLSTEFSEADPGSLVATATTNARDSRHCPAIVSNGHLRSCSSGLGGVDGVDGFRRSRRYGWLAGPRRIRETKWNGSRTWDTNGYRIWYSGSGTARNGVSVILTTELRDKVVQVKKSSDRVMAISMVIEGETINVISAYAPRSLRFVSEGCNLPPSCALLLRFDIYAAGFENHPPILNKDNYVPWSSRIIRYARSRPNGKMIFNSIENGPYVRRMIATPGEPDLHVPVPESFHEQTDEEITKNDIKRMDADDQAIQTILLGLPEDVYDAVDSCETAKEIWECV